MDFFEHWFAKTTQDIEIRLLPSRKQLFGRDQDKLGAFLENNPNENAFFSVCSRTGHQGDKAHVAEVPGLWVDLDGYKVSDHGQIKESHTVSLARLKAFQYRPTYIIDSGHGIHAYWFFKEAEKPSDHIESILRGLAKTLGGDMSSAELARVMRIPGTTNYKNDPVPCAIIQANENEYLLSDFEQYAGEERPSAARKSEGDLSGDITRITGSCAFLKHCYDHQESISEPLWYACISNISRLPNDIHLCHAFSERHPGYTERGLNEKFIHAKKDTEPHTCRYIRENGFDGCPSEGCGVTSPIVAVKGNSSISNIIYKDNLDNRTIVDGQGFTDPPILNSLDNSKGVFDVSSVLKKGSDLLLLDIKVEWIIENILPKQSITLLHGRGGIGKTWLSLVMADAISKGIPFMGLSTERSPVIFVDFENSYPVLVERVQKIQAGDVLFWHNTYEVRPPKLDKVDWTQYKQLPAGLIIFDTLRASQTQDENDSRHMAFIMSRLKELRDQGFTILLLHHTPKSNDRTYKGSTAILDLADHVLSLHKVRKGSEQEADDDEDSNYYRFGTKDKTRYEPYHMFLEFQKERGFVVASDPDTEKMEEIHDLLKSREPMKQGDAFALVKDELGITSKGTFVRLLRKGTGTFWTAEKQPHGRGILYCPIVQPLYETKRTIGSDHQPQTVDSNVLSYCPTNNNKDRTIGLFDTVDKDFPSEVNLPDVERWGF